MSDVAVFVEKVSGNYLLFTREHVLTSDICVTVPIDFKRGSG